MRPSSVTVCLGIALVHLLGGVNSTPLVDTTPPQSNVFAALETVPDIDAFRTANPDINITPLRSERIEGATNRQQVVYTLGSRTVGDRLVGLSSDNKSWVTPQNVKLDLQYPTAGLGAVVSYVELVVNQSTASGQAYVVSGGVGQRFVRLVVEAYGTTYFNYTAAIYGF